MSYAIDLSQRQSARTLEQAVRHNALISLRPRCREDTPALICRLEQPENHLEGTATRRYLIALLANDPEQRIEYLIDDYRELVGCYCDTNMTLGEHRYMFSTDVVELLPAPPQPGGVVFKLTLPPVIQVAQRRRFRRIKLAQSTQVALKWTDDNQAAGGGVGWLCNLSQDGMACRTEAHTADRLCIGQELIVEFGLSPESSQRFLMDAMLCSKTPAGNQGKIILGMHFLADKNHYETCRQSEKLRQALAQWYAQAPSQSKGADL